MYAALGTLLWLNFRAGLRRIGRQLRTVRGVLFFVIGLCVIGIWIVPQIFLNTKVPQADPHAALAAGPAIIFLMCAMNIFTSAGERAVTFTPAEIDFLFPGPFSRRSLLIYKLIKTGLATIFSAIIIGIVLRRFGGLYIYRVGGLWLLFQFMQLLAMTVALVQSNVGERIMANSRRWIFIAIVALVALALTQAFSGHHDWSLARLAEARETVTARVVLAPFGIFAHMLVARNFFHDFLRWAIVAAMIDLAMAAVVIGLDANFLETSASLSAKRYARLSRFRRSGLVGMAKPAGASWKIPMLPWAAGAGPIVWRQMTTALRTTRPMLILFSAVAIGAGIAIPRLHDQKAAAGFLAGIVVYFNLILSQMFKFDFRGDLDCLDVLRSYPLRPTAVAAAQLVVPATILSIVQILLLATVAITGHFPWLLLLVGAVLVLPLNLMTIAVDNLIFLILPYRPAAALAGDMGLVGRQTIVAGCRVLLMILVLAISAGVGVGVWFLCRHSLTAAGVAAGFPLAGAIGLIVWFIGKAFNRFDPSVSTPS